MKNWQDCKKISHEIRTIQFDSKPIEMKYWNFKSCYDCEENKCKRKIQMRAENKAIKDISRI